MACSLSSFCSLNQAFCRHKLLQYPKLRSQEGFRDNGKQAKIVDANLRVLRERIEQVRKREGLIDTCGWNYKHNYDRKYKDSIVSQSTEMMGLACGAIGLVFLIGSLTLCLVSLLVYICV